MAKPNYSFEKRQRDLAKKQKQEEKRQKKLAAKAAAGDAGEDSAGRSPNAETAHHEGKAPDA